MDDRNMYQYDFDSAYAPALTLNQYISRTFGWMFMGLLTTFALAAVLSYTGLVFYVFMIPYALPVITVLELVVVLFFSASILKRSVAVTRTLFFLYAILNGIVFSAYFIMFDVINLIAIFGLTALFFGGFALYGRFTKVDLSGLRPLIVGGLIFLVIAGLLSLFINFAPFERIICMVGIVIFLCFTAYDTQKIKANYDYFYNDTFMLEKASVYSALQLYLDFINLFLYLLRFMGKNRK